MEGMDVWVLTPGYSLNPITEEGAIELIEQESGHYSNTEGYIFFFARLTTDEELEEV